MKKTLFSVIATVAVFFISLLSVNIALCQNLNSTLESLNPFLGNTWIGKLKSPDGSKELTVLRTYEIIPKGNVLKCIKKNPELDNYAEEFFFWDDIEKKIAFFSIGDLGVFENGFVTIDNNIVTIEGTMTWPK
ncbi:MAG: hypothetical protein JXR31_11150, partial [Prolixibacteraceae bacterium]|nr:hypothetical protein [Prolixibacteraceae bacterium]